MSWFKKWWPVVFLGAALVMLVTAGLTEQVVNYCFNNVGLGFSPDEAEWYIVTDNAGVPKYVVVIEDSGEATSLERMYSLGTLDGLTQSSIKRQIAKQEPIPINVARAP